MRVEAGAGPVGVVPAEAVLATVDEVVLEDGPAIGQIAQGHALAVAPARGEQAVVPQVVLRRQREVPDLELERDRLDDAAAHADPEGGRILARQGARGHEAVDPDDFRDSRLDREGSGQVARVALVGIAEGDQGVGPDLVEAVVAGVVVPRDLDVGVVLQVEVQIRGRDAAAGAREVARERQVDGGERFARAQGDLEGDDLVAGRVELNRLRAALPEEVARLVGGVLEELLRVTRRPDLEGGRRPARDRESQGKHENAEPARDPRSQHGDPPDKGAKRRGRSARRATLARPHRHRARSASFGAAASAPKGSASRVCRPPRPADRRGSRPAGARSPRRRPRRSRPARPGCRHPGGAG